jgi:hypothetical protein
VAAELVADGLEHARPQGEEGGDKTTGLVGQGAALGPQPRVLRKLAQALGVKVGQLAPER